MSDKTPRPDRADAHDLDVPTYDGSPDNPKPGSTRASSRNNESASEQQGQSVYDRAGRAAPQEIQPNSGQNTDNPDATTAFPASGRASRPGRDDEPVPATEATPVNQRSNYRDEDFAPTEATPARGSEPTAVAPAAGAGAAAAPATDYDRPVDGTHPEYDDSAPRDHRRGTIDLGLLIARLLLGVWLILESVGTFFQLGDSTGLSGLESDFGAYPMAGILSIAVPTMQLAAGVFLVVGLITPLAAAVATVVTGFVALHELASSGAGFDIFSWPDSVWLSIILFGLSIALQFTGPGFYAIDGGRRWARRPLASSWIFIVVAIAGLVALWWFGTAINPFA